MKTPLDNEELQPSEEWAKLKHYVSSPKSGNGMPENFEQNVVTKILLSASSVKAPDNFEDEVLRRIAAESQPVLPQNWERIISALKTRTAAVIGVVALITGGTISIYTVNQQPSQAVVAPLLQKNDVGEMDLSPVRVERDTRYDNVKQVTNEKASLMQDSSKHPIPGKPMQGPVKPPEEDF